MYTLNVLPLYFKETEKEKKSNNFSAILYNFVNISAITLGM